MKLFTKGTSPFRFALEVFAAVLIFAVLSVVILTLVPPTFVETAFGAQFVLFTEFITQSSVWIALVAFVFQWIRNSSL